MINFKNIISIKELFLIKYQFIVNALLLILFNILLLSAPLTNVLGYELSAINSLILLMISGLFTISWQKKVKKFSSAFFLVMAVFFFIPLFISLTHSVFTHFCSFWDGIAFYFVITFPAIIIGFAFAILIFYLFNKFRIIIFIILILLIAIIPVLEIYFNPQIYFYNPLIAYFPGTVYDEAMSVDFKLILYRIFNIFFSLGIIYLVIKDHKQVKKLINTIIILSILIIFYVFKSPLGFSTTYSKLINLLPDKLETENFIIHSQAGFADDEEKIIALYTQYYFESLRKSINVLPKKKIEIFLFENIEQKKEYFGSGAADVAKPWLYQIYISRNSWSNTLKHEMAHIFSAEFGSTIFKVAYAFNPFFIEGFASSQDPFRENLHIDYLSAIANDEISFEKISYLMTGFNFFASNSFLTYTYAGSFSKYLIDTYGIEKFKRFYSTLDYISIYNKSYKSVIEEYTNFLKEYPFKKNEHRFNYYFGRQSIVQKTCPRYIGKLLNKGWEQVNEKNYEKAKETFANILDKTHNYSALIGFTVCLEKQDSASQSVKLLEKYIDHFYKTPYYYLLKLNLADFYTKSSMFNEAKEISSNLIYQKPTINIELIAHLRYKLLNENLIQNYLTGNDSVKFELLKVLNRKEYFYPSFPALINLAISTKEVYKNFIKQFDKTKFIEDFYSAYAVYQLSDYMIMNFDFRNARKMAALARRFKDEEHLNVLFKENFEKAEWFYYNADEFLEQFISKQTN